ncbi:hypothetical protein OQX61_00620 [Pedobacter sp. PLR]|uniref:hypothetical protein n=1 Tax=Pedobacter sp. PLR TaxID=2994465 RepID=UPI002246D6E6|nr:hypothetical protein [Pedobacter sp. PLR]MCX2449757.1 hypothetical protein [Pedobacter sp. PLR]
MLFWFRPKTSKRKIDEFIPCTTGSCNDMLFIVFLLWSNIESIIPESSVKFKTKKEIDAQGKLVTSGFIDRHIHPTDVFGDYKKAPVFLARDSLKVFRKRLSAQYLPFGTTTVLTMGQPENWLEPLLKWQKQTEPDNVDLFIAGGALISKEQRVPYIGHAMMETHGAARQKVKEYHRRGINRIKLYYRLQRPEFIAAFRHLEKEYHVLKEKLKHMPGKPS